MTVKRSFSWSVVTIETVFVPAESTVVFDGMSNVSGVWSAFPIRERSYWCFRRSAMMYDWNFWSLCSKFSGSFWAMDVRRRIERLFLFMKRWHQCTEALKSDSLIFFSFANDRAFKRISVVETAIPALRFSSIHCVNSVSNSGNFGKQSRAALWSRRCSFKTAWFCLHLRTFFSSTWYWRAAARFPFSKAHVTTVSLKRDVYDILVDPFGFMISSKWVAFYLWRLFGVFSFVQEHRISVTMVIY